MFLRELLKTVKISMSTTSIETEGNEGAPSVGSWVIVVRLLATKGFFSEFLN